jgi:hypothetical protein
MRRLLFILLLLPLFAQGGCNDTSGSKGNKMTDDNLLSRVKLAINPKYQDWVLFKNGTYIIFDNGDTISNIEEEAIKSMKEYGPVFGGGPAGDFNVIRLNRTEGWVVSGHGYGMYTYVSPNELALETPTDVEIGLYGRNKRDLDGKNPIVVHTNRKPK